MVVEVRALFAREFADANAGINSPRVEQLVSDLWHNYQLLADRKRDVALVEQMVDVRRQEEPVGAVKALGVGCVPPRLYVARL